jgi:hypothetical protein
MPDDSRPRYHFVPPARGLTDAEILAMVEVDPAMWEGLSHSERSAVLNELTRLAREK